jgi:hypothetical protein
MTFGMTFVHLGKYSMHDKNKKGHIPIMNRCRHKQTIVFLQINQHFCKYKAKTIYTLLKIKFKYLTFY